jgi:hypothetical protein
MLAMKERRAQKWTYHCSLGTITFSNNRFQSCDCFNRFIPFKSRLCKIFGQRGVGSANRHEKFPQRRIKYSVEIDEVSHSRGTASVMCWCDRNCHVPARMSCEEDYVATNYSWPSHVTLRSINRLRSSRRKSSLPRSPVCVVRASEINRSPVIRHFEWMILTNTGLESKQIRG